MITLKAILHFFFFVSNPCFVGIATWGTATTSGAARSLGIWSFLMVFKGLLCFVESLFKGFLSFFQRPSYSFLKGFPFFNKKGNYRENVGE